MAHSKRFHVGETYQNLDSKVIAKIVGIWYTKDFVQKSVEFETANGKKSTKSVLEFLVLIESGKVKRIF